MARRALSQSNFVRMLLAQGAVIPCGKCKRPITDPKNIEREHLNELEISGDDSVGNQQLWHKRPCSHEKTNGRPATTLGSSKHVIAKARRMERARTEPKKQSALSRRCEWAKQEKAKRKAQERAQ
jgi:hypothetical protein